MLSSASRIDLSNVPRVRDSTDNTLLFGFAACMTRLWHEDINEHNAIAWYRYNIQNKPENAVLFAPYTRMLPVRKVGRSTVTMTIEGIQKVVSLLSQPRGVLVASGATRYLLWEHAHLHN